MPASKSQLHEIPASDGSGSLRGKMDCHGLTDPGRKRPGNEDQFLIADLNKSMLIHQTTLSHDDHTRLFGGSQGKLLLVADGMGGHAAGEQASRIAVEALARYVINTRNWFFRLCEDEEEDLKEDLRAGLEECQRRVEAAASARPDLRGMGTTLTMAYLLWPRLYVVHAGDSRCYLLRDGRPEQVTCDHTVAQQLVDRGVLPADQVQGSRWSHVLWNCIGGGTHDLNPDVYKLTLRVGDTLLLCTDGLTAVLKDEDLVEILQQRTSAEETCRRLVDAANTRGGPDNITVIVAHFRPAEELEARPAAQAAVAETTEWAPEVPVPAVPAPATAVG
jgi:protein phosphatase